MIRSNTPVLKTTLRPRAFPSLFVFLFLAFGTTVAQASSWGAVQGDVIDSNGDPIGGARVVVEGLELHGNTRVAVSDSKGRFRFVNVPPVTVTVRLANPSATKGLPPPSVAFEVPAGGTARVTLVVGEKSGDDALRTRVAPLASGDVAPTWRITPTFANRVFTTRRMTSLAFFAPGVVPAAAAPLNPSIHGNGAFANQLQLDGARLTDPVLGTIDRQIPFDSVRATRIMTAGLDAEHGFATGGLIDVVSRSGSDEFIIDASAYWSPGALALTDDGEAEPTSEISANLLASGPIIKRKLWFLAATTIGDESEAAGPGGSIEDLASIIPQSRREVLAIGKLNYRPFPWQDFALTVFGDPSWGAQKLEDAAQIEPEAERQRFGGGLHASLTSRTQLAEPIIWSTVVSYSNTRLQLQPRSGDRTRAGHVDVLTGERSVNDTLYSDDTRFRMNFRSDVTWFLDDFLGDHEFKGGVEAQLVWAWLEEDRNGGQTFFDQGRDDDGNPVPLERRDVIRGVDQQVWGDSISAFVQDAWRPLPQLTLRAGVRVDSSRQYLDPGAGGGPAVQINWISPRIGVAWDPFGDGRTSLRAGYFHYADTGALALARAADSGLTEQVYGYNPETGAYDIDKGRVTTGTGVEVDPITTPPHTHEIVLGLRREILEDTVVGADIVLRRTQFLVEDTETNLRWDGAGTSVVGGADGTTTPRQVLTTLEDAYHQSAAVDLSVQKRLSRGWSLMATYTFSRLEGTTPGGATPAFDNPTQLPFLFGPLDNDILHVAQVHTTYDLPLGFGVGGSVVFQSGRPASALTYNPVWDDYTDFAAPRGQSAGDPLVAGDESPRRLPDQLTLRARLMWRLKELTTQDIWIIADVDNILNLRPATRIEERLFADIPYGSVIERAPPLRVKVGVRVRF